jgi:hypothetical protein
LRAPPDPSNQPGEKAARLRLLDEAARPTGEDIVPFTRHEVRAIASSIRKDVHQLTVLRSRLARFTDEG